VNRRNYAVVTAAYWGFTLTDGALRMLVLLEFARRGFSPFTLALLFALYELCGVVTNLAGGWIASRLGLRFTLTAGLALQVVALGALAFLDPAWPEWVAVGYVMAAQALSGVAKDLTKMSAKSAIKVLVPVDAKGSLFKWVAALTGSKNALKGVGFFLGGLLLASAGFSGALGWLAGALAVLWVAVSLALPRELGGRAKTKGFRSLFAKSRPINVLCVARFFLFGARDIWFVVGVPVFLRAVLGWSVTEVGTFMALWVIGYGLVQGSAPTLLRGRAPAGGTAASWAFALAATAGAIPLALLAGAPVGWVVPGGLALFGAVFAVNSAAHSYLILDYTDGDKVALDVGFYYMANAGGRLVGCLLSGACYQLAGLQGCLWGAAAFALASAVAALGLPRAALHAEKLAAAQVKAEGD
jgi:predicted MFS family arabinose efflux permease